ncbi:peptidyl-tRNA hydrolase [Geodermatophilus sp. FMUSA9-8]|uniref:peptidyl-tRNA hydrolase n=1 Tax=Geodermatophilus sp. FMUSA9-8 TaxID=3120155 RepID=UPI00300AC97D
MYEDPAGESPWAMQLVARVERTSPPSRSAVCAAAAVAVVRLLGDERAGEGGEWSASVRRWTDGAIRKHCRRARGVAWERAGALPGVTASVAGAEVRALVPTALDALPRDVAKLQLTGSELDDADALPVADPVPGGPLVVSVCPEPFLPLGKAAAACGHAAQLSALRMPARRLEAWAAAGYPVAVEHPDVARWARLRAAAPVAVVDAGFTVVEPGTTTALARWA